MICQAFSECFLIDTYRISSKMTAGRALRLCFKESRVLAVVLLRISQYLWSKKIIWRLAPIIKRMNEIFTGFECHLEASIGSGLLLAHTQNIVIGAGVKIAEQVTLYNGTTLGAVAKDSSIKNNNYPQLMHGVIVYSGAKVLGNIVIGKDSVIGSNAVVLRNVPDRCLAVGIPARIIMRKNQI